MTPEEVKLLVERLKAECFCGLCPTCEAASALTLLAQEREELRGALRAINELPAECVNSLICQRQIDADGTEVGVSRQAVDEIHAALVAARAALKDT